MTYSNSPPFNRHTPDFYFPFFTFIELLSYMGWIKVAETLLNPFGADDEDFQVNYIIDRNLQVSYLMVDEAEEALEMAEDPFLEAGIHIPKDLPAYVNRSAKAMTPSEELDTVSVSSSVKGRNGKGGGILERFQTSFRVTKDVGKEANPPLEGGEDEREEQKNRTFQVI